jgi:glycosyltransferase involved in cell wall biosynthesis
MLTIVLAVLGNYIWIESELAKTIKHLVGIDNPEVEIIIVLDGKQWLSIPILRTLSSQKLPIKIIIKENPGNDFASLWNLALKELQTGYILFIWPGCLPDLHAVRENLIGESIVSFTDPNVFSQINAAPELILSQIHHVLQCKNIFQLQNTFIHRSIFSSIGEFDESPLNGNDCTWEFFLRAEEHHIRINLLSGGICHARWELTDFPVNQVSRIPIHISHFYSIKAAKQINKEAVFLKNLYADIPDSDKYPCLQKVEINPVSNGKAPPIKIAVISGIYDYVHNQLCFYNYFESLFGRGDFMFIPLLDIIVQPQRDLSEMNCVIISRGREYNLLEVLKYCKKNHIPTIYMIDDNWFWVGKDWEKDYGKMFSPGSISYQVFMKCLAECDAVMVYSKIMAEDVSPYAQKIIQLPVNIQPDHFSNKITSPELQKIVDEVLDWRKETHGLVIGYAGSLRYTDVAFKALYEAIKSCKTPIKPLLFGHFTQKQMEIFKNGDPILIPYTNYQNYASFLGNLQPDLLLAPLEENRTSMSKAPNKYLEYSVIGAAGIYSNVSPYTDVIRSGVNGILVENNIDAWKKAILELIMHPEGMKRIAVNAKNEVIEKYSTSKISKEFIEAINSIVHEK